MEARLSENAQKYDRDTAATLGSIVESKNGGWLRTRLALPSVLDRLPCQLQARQSVSKSFVSVSPQGVNTCKLQIVVALSLIIVPILLSSIMYICVCPWHTASEMFT